MQATNIQGTSPIALTCSLGRWSVDNLAILLQRNADVTVPDINGQTCLDLSLSPYLVSPWHRTPINRLSRAIVLLIKNGANVYATDNFGLSVSDVAYTDFQKPSYQSLRGC